MNVPEPLELSQLLLALFDEHSDALFVKDPQGRYLLFNRAAGRLVGRDPKEVIGLDDTTIFNTESARRVKERDRQVLETGKPHQSLEILTAAGLTRIYKATKAPIFNEKGEVCAVLGFSQDITDSERAREELEYNEHVLRLILEAIPIGVQVMNETGDIFHFNPAAERIWGNIIKPGEMRYRKVQARWHETGELLEKEDWASIRALRRGLVSTGQMVDVEAFDGQIRTILNSGAPIRDQNGAILGAVITNEDLTDRIQLERQVLQAQKMEAVGQLAAGTAHDFNNLLTVISASQELLLQSPNLSPEERDLASQGLSAAQRAAALTRQLLAFARQSVLKPVVLDLNQTLIKLGPMLQRLLGDTTGLLLSLCEEPAHIYIDPVTLDQVLLNLVINAKDALSESGTVQIETSLSQKDSNEVVLVVRDDGIGMTPDVANRIFEPFFTTKGERGGSGLGLATVYGIVQQSGGRISVESRLDEGTTFTLVLPRHVPEDRSPNVHPSNLVNLPNEERLLVVEDQEAVRRVLVTALQRAGYNVLSAEHGEEALLIWAAEDGAIDLLITDVVMPGMNGRQLAERLQESQPALKVLFMSGHTDDSVLRRGVERRSVTFLQKPFPIKELLSKVRTLLDPKEGSVSKVQKSSLCNEPDNS